MFFKVRFIIVHMLQEEVVLTLVITAALLWILNMRLSSYSTKTKEAALSRRLAVLYLVLIPVIAVIGRVLR
jgi:hypothetical protein